MTSRRRRVDIPVLAYHRVGEPPPGAPHPDTYVRPRSFSRQLSLLKALGYRPIGADDYLKARAGEPCALPPKPVLITFDDGSSTVLSEAAPPLSRHGFPAALFMVSSRMGGAAAWDGEADGCGHRQLSPDELRALQAQGWTIGSHTESHARLTALRPEDAASELKASKDALEGLLGREVAWFAYPYGDFDDGLKAAVARAGYRAAFATERGDGGDFSIPRRIISGRTSLLGFWRRLRQAAKLAGRGGAGEA